MSVFLPRSLPLRNGFSQVIFRSHQRGILGCQWRTYASSGDIKPFVKSKNAYGDDIFTANEATEALPVMDKVAEVVPEASFQSLGLGGSSPVGLMQQVLEFLHVSADLPWWGAIATGTAAVRLCLFPIVVKNRQELVKIMVANFEMSKLLMEMIKAQKENRGSDVLEMAKRRDTIMARIRFHKIILPVLAQSCVFISMMLAVRQISACPIESLATGGLAWFSDLTAPDPFGVLPMITASSIMAILFIGRDPNAPVPKPVLMFFYAMCPIVFICLFKYEAAFTFYLCTNSVITIGQAALLSLPAVKSHFNIAMPKLERQENAPFDDVKELLRAMEVMKERDMLEKFEKKQKEVEKQREEQKKKHSREDEKND